MGQTSSSGVELQAAAMTGPSRALEPTPGTVVGEGVVAGASVTPHQNVTLDDRQPDGGPRRLGGDVTVAAGACILGSVTVGDRVVIAANAVVLCDVPSDGVMAGIRAIVASGLRADAGVT